MPVTRSFGLGRVTRRLGASVLGLGVLFQAAAAVAPAALTAPTAAGRPPAAAPAVAAPAPAAGATVAVPGAAATPAVLGPVPTEPAAPPVPAPPTADMPAGDATSVSALAADGIPVVALRAYQRAAAATDAADPGCRLSWTLLAGIGRVESDHGRFGGAVLLANGTSSIPVIGIPLNGVGTEVVTDTDDGRLDGDPVFDRAIGPMQFIPSTWAVYGADGDGNGTADPFDIDDAALAAAHYLCATGNDLATHAGQVAAVLTYNHSSAYVAEVLALAAAYAGGTTVEPAPVVAAGLPGTAPVPAPSGALPTSGAPAAPEPAASTSRPPGGPPVPASSSTAPQSTDSAAPSSSPTRSVTASTPAPTSTVPTTPPAGPTSACAGPSGSPSPDPSPDPTDTATTGDPGPTPSSTGPTVTDTTTATDSTTASDTATASASATDSTPACAPTGGPRPVAGAVVGELAAALVALCGAAVRRRRRSAHA